MSVDLSQFIGEFLQESYEGLDVMESCLLAFDNDPEQVDSIFRAAHSIKGGAGTFGFVEVAAFTHNAETLLDEIRKLTIEVDDEIINVLLESVDILRNMLRATEQNEPQNTSQIDAVSEQLERILAQNGKDDSATLSQKENQEREQEGAVALKIQETQSNDMEQKGLVVEWLIHFTPKPKILQSGNEPMFIFEALAEIGPVSIEVISDQLPSIEDFDAEQLYVSWILTLDTESLDQTNEYALEQIHEVFEWVEDFSDIDISPSRYAQAAVILVSEGENVTPDSNLQNSNIANSEQSKLAAQQGALTELNEKLTVNEKPKSSLDEDESDVAASNDSGTEQVDKSADLQRQKSAKQQGAEINSVRVDIERLDELLNRVGELVVTQAMLSQAGREAVKAGLQNQRLEQGLLQLESNTRDLQQDVMRMRMLPISFVFNRYLRLVHDISAKLGKKVSLQITGEQTEIDKTVMEKIGDPLTHLIRNALDHGMETSQERIQLGKSAKGTISLNAYHHNGFIVIDVIDDGRGLNLDKIQQKAVQKKLITADQQLSDDELKNLIFKPGFSTVDQLSELSGRGVGMDVVLRNIESLGGQIAVDSRVGEGTSFSVRVPLTLAIIEGQLIKINDENYVIPLVSIIETILVKSGDVKRLADHDEFINYRDEYIHLINLGSLFSQEKNANNLALIDDSLSEQTQQENIETVKLIIVVESIGKKVGFIVDQLAAQQQFVVKPLETNFKKVAGIVGGTILGDGSVALILDSAGLINHCERLSTQDQSDTGVSKH